MADEHRQAYRRALKLNAEISALFAQLGTAQNPRGRVLTAYRQARKALATDLRKGDRRGASATLAALRADVLQSAGALLTGAREVGNGAATDMLNLYGINPPAPTNAASETERAAGNVVAARLDAQLAAAQAALLTGGAASALLGDGVRQGIITADPVQRECGKWVGVVAIAALVYYFSLSKAPAVSTAGMPVKQMQFVRQAVAGIDERTTDCCLRVTGQTRPMGVEFHLTGTPRFADYLINPPFHYWCRTATALVLEEMAGDALTAEIRDAARAELSARATTGKREVIHPASATSRRGQGG